MKTTHCLLLCAALSFALCLCGCSDTDRSCETGSQSGSNNVHSAPDSVLGSIRAELEADSAEILSIGFASETESMLCTEDVTSVVKAVYTSDIEGKTAAFYLLNGEEVCEVRKVPLTYSSGISPFYGRGMNDPISPIDTIQAALEKKSTEDYVISFEVNSIEYDPISAEWYCMQLAHEYSADDHAPSFNELAESHTAVKTEYTAEYDGTKTPESGGSCKAVYYLQKDEASHEWQITDVSFARSGSYYSADGSPLAAVYQSLKENGITVIDMEYVAQTSAQACTLMEHFLVTGYVPAGQPCIIKAEYLLPSGKCAAGYYLLEYSLAYNSAHFEQWNITDIFMPYELPSESGSDPLAAISA